MAWTSVLNGVSTEAQQVALKSLIGEISASPTANTVLARLKLVHENVAGLRGAANSDLTTLESAIGAFKDSFDVRDIASDAKLELVRLLLESIDNKDFATQQTLEQFRSEFAGRDLATGATLVQLLEKTSTPVVQQVEAGLIFNASVYFDGIGGSLSSDQPVARIENPIGSGKIIYISKLTIASSIGQWYRVIEDAVLDSPTVEANAIKSWNRGSAAASAAVIESDTTAPASGTPWDARIRIPSSLGTGSFQLPPLILPEGKAFVIAGDSSATQTTSFFVDYLEVPAA